jgi:hypothetical protein
MKIIFVQISPVFVAYRTLAAMLSSANWKGGNVESSNRPSEGETITESTQHHPSTLYFTLTITRRHLIIASIKYDQIKLEL